MPKRRLQRPGSYIPRFRDILAQVAKHPNRRYFMLKSIIINNLYGVDIMEEATEICKLRLFLKLVAQIERFEDIEPLPDIDFNIRAGNTLVGFATQEEVGGPLHVHLRSLTSTDAWQASSRRPRSRARFRPFPLTADGNFNLIPLIGREQRSTCGRNSSVLRAELDRYLAASMALTSNNITKKEAYDEKFDAMATEPSALPLVRGVLRHHEEWRL